MAKRCSSCKQHKSDEDFSAGQYYCRECKREYAQKYNYRPPKLRRRTEPRRYKRRVSVPLEQRVARDTKIIDTLNKQLMKQLSTPTQWRHYKRGSLEARTKEQKAEFRAYRMRRMRHNRKDVPEPYGRKMKLSSFTAAQVREVVERDRCCVVCGERRLSAQHKESLEDFKIKQPPELLHVVCAKWPPLTGGWSADDLQYLCAQHYAEQLPDYETERLLRKKLGVPCLVEPGEILEGVVTWSEQPYQERCNETHQNQE